MPIFYTCPDCGAQIEVNDSLAGKRIRCRECDALGRVPSPPALAASEEPISPDWRTLRISARIISWPARCSCCLSPSPETSLDVFSVRVEGVRVIRASERSWSVPYCSRCHEHASLLRRAQEIELTRRRPSQATTATYLLSTSLAIACVSPLMMGLFALAAPGSFERQLGAVIFALCLVAAAALGIAGFFVRQKEKQKRRQEQLRYVGEGQQAESYRAEAVSLLADSCACVGDAVEYRGWKGTVHTFAFANARYFEAFFLANERKIIG